MMSVGKNRVLTESCWAIPIISMNMNRVIQIHTALCAPASAVSFFELFDPRVLQVHLLIHRTRYPRSRKVRNNNNNNINFVCY